MRSPRRLTTDNSENLKAMVSHFHSISSLALFWKWACERDRGTLATVQDLPYRRCQLVCEWVTDKIIAPESKVMLPTKFKWKIINVLSGAIVYDFWKMCLVAHLFSIERRTSCEKKEKVKVKKYAFAIYQSSSKRKLHARQKLSSPRFQRHIYKTL